MIRPSGESLDLSIALKSGLVRENPRPYGLGFCLLRWDLYPGYPLFNRDAHAAGGSLNHALCSFNRACV